MAQSGRGQGIVGYRSREGWQVKRAEQASRAPARSLQLPLKICDIQGSRGFTA
jgi:hypothetical protein